MRSIFIFSFFCFIISANAQRGIVKGRLFTDKHAPISGATICLLKAGDSSNYKIGISDTDGNFEFKNVLYNNYSLKVSAINFTGFRSSPFLIDSILPFINLPDIILKSEMVTLKSVSISSKKPLVELRTDRMIINVDGAISSSGSNALELLEKSPNITIDNNGGISVKGKQGVVILIDNKATYLKGQDLTDFLKNIPASQLEQLEIITQPSSKYDAAGTAGVINFKTKKSNQLGFNGSLSLGYVQTFYGRTTNSLSLNYRKSKTNIFLTYSFSYLRSFNDLVIRHTIIDAHTNHKILFDQINNTLGLTSPHNLLTGIDYTINTSTNIGISFNGQTDPKRKINVSGKSNQIDLSNNNKLVATNYSQTSNKYDLLNYNINGYLDHRFSDKKELSIDGNYLTYNKKFDQTSDNYLYDDKGNLINDPQQINPYLTKGNLPSTIKISTLKIDYSDNYNKLVKFNSGLKTAYISSDNDAQYLYFDNTWKNNLDQSNHFLYKERVIAGYIDLEKSFNKVIFQAGIRGEQTSTNGHQVVKNERHDSAYFDLFPTASIKFIPNDNHQFNISYSKRIDRPAYPDMNPFKYFFDKYTYLQGNPFLLPQISQSIEGGYKFKSELTIAASFSKTINVISEVLHQTDSLGILFQNKENVNKLRYIGLNISYAKDLTKWLNVSATANIFNNKYSGYVNEQTLESDRTAATFNVNTQWQFNKYWKGELSGYYNTLTYYNALTSLFPQKNISFGFSKLILNSKGTFKINFKDPFGLLNSGGDTHYGKVDHYVLLKWNSRGVGVTVSYRFGKKVASSKKKADSASDEKSRVE